ncbi:MAG TPA: hypothetical protein DHU56_06985 [Marinobacter sp.]|nr:hypothetical protein [Marinobacter sp.]
MVSGRAFIGAALYGTQLVIILQDMDNRHHPESATPLLNSVVAVQGHDLLLDGLVASGFSERPMRRYRQYPISARPQRRH